MDSYKLETLFSSIDLQGMYAYGQQPLITKWNLARFAETLLPYIDKNKDKAIKIATKTINEFDSIYEKKWYDMMKSKLGLIGNKNEDKKIISDFLTWMENNKADYTNTFVFLLNDDFRNNKIYEKETFINWHKKWKDRINNKSKDLMKKTNPNLIPRNHIVERVLKAAENNDLNPFNKFLEVLQKPYKMYDDISSYQTPGENLPDYKTFCGT